MPKNGLLSRLSIRINLLIPLGAVFLVGFGLFISLITVDQMAKKTADFEFLKVNTMELIAMTNVDNVWNVNAEATEQNLISFLKNKEIVGIEVKDSQDKSFKKVEKEHQGSVTVMRRDIVREGNPLGQVEVSFTDYFITEARDSMLALFLVMGLALFALIIVSLVFIANFITAPISRLTSLAVSISQGDTAKNVSLNSTRSREITDLAGALERMTGELKSRAERFRTANDLLTEIIKTAQGIVSNLNSSSREIEAAAQEQTSASNEHASGITEVSATLQELTITAKQITANVGELVLASEEAVKHLKESEKRLLVTVTQLDEAGEISRKNSAEINELGKRSVLINEMVELIKEVANKTNILSINASIEASRSGEAGSGFSVVAAEIRELSKETIESAKKADKAAKEIQDFLDSIIGSSEHGASKVIESGHTVRDVHNSMGEVVARINSNYSFTQKIDVSIKQQETGSIQAAETMRQMAEISRQSAETARQVLQTVKDIVDMASGLSRAIEKYQPEATAN